MMLMQTCHIISGPASTEQQTKEKVRYQGTEYVMNSVTGCFESMFSLHVKDDSLLYQVPPRRLVYILQETLEEELGRLQN